MITNRQLFLSHLAQTTSFPLMLEIERAEGMYLYGENGEKVMDLISGIGVSNIGHRHPKVIQAIKKQGINTCTSWSMAKWYRVLR